MSILSEIRTASGNWKPTRRFFKKLSLAAFLIWFAFHPGYVSCRHVFPSYVRIHYLHGRLDNILHVVDAKTKQPIPGAFVNVTWINEMASVGGTVTAPLATRELLTDANGRFRPYRWIERGDMVIVDVWKPGYRLGKSSIIENEFDDRVISSPIALEPWTGVMDALQGPCPSGVNYGAMQRSWSKYEDRLLELRRRGVDDVKQAAIDGGKK